MRKGRERGYRLGPGAQPTCLCKQNKQTAEIPQEAEPANPLQDLSHRQCRLLRPSSTLRLWFLLGSPPVRPQQAAILATVAHKLYCVSFHLSPQWVTRQFSSVTLGAGA